MSKEADRVALAIAKERLVREGELYRVSVAHARGQLANATHPDSLMHGAVDHALGIVQHRLGALFGGAHGGSLAGVAGLASGLSIPKLLPYAIKAGSFIVRKRLLKPVLLAGVTAAIAGFWISRNKQP